MASRIRLAMSWSVTTARTSSLPPQRAQAFTSISNVLASSVAHGTFEVAAKRRPPSMRARCLADRTLDIGTSAPTMLRASVVAETDCQLLPVSRTAFLLVVKTNAEFAASLLGALAERLRKLTAQLK